MKTLIYTAIYASIAYVMILPLYYFLDLKGSYVPTDLFLFLGATTGLMLFVVMFWQYVLSLKILTKFFQLDLSTVVALHKDLGIYSVMLLLFHPINLIIDSLLGSGYLHIIPDFASTYDFRIFLGEVAFLLFLFTWFISYIIKKNLTFRFWKKLHLFAYLILPITYLHADDIGSFISNPPLNLAIKGFTFVFVLMVFARILDASGFLKYKYKVVSKKMYNDILELTLQPVNVASKIQSKFGQFIYVQTKAFGEAHPYSILWNGNSDGVLTLGIKVNGQFGQELADLQEGQVVMLDGPHGKFLNNLKGQSHLVFIAGGIGITPFVETVANSNTMNDITRIDFFYATRTLNDSVFVNKKTVAAWPKVKLVNVLSNQVEPVSEPNVELGMVNFELIQKHINTSTHVCDYYICGPMPMMKAVVKSLLDNGVDIKKIHTEEFSW